MPQGPGSRRRIKCSWHLFGLLACFAPAIFSAPVAVAAQAEPVLDTARALALLHEAAAEYAASGHLRDDPEFGQQLRTAFWLWGEQWTPESQAEPKAIREGNAWDIANSLVRVGEIDRARAFALSQSDGWRRLAIQPVLDWMAARGRTAEIIALVDSIGDVRPAIGAIFGTKGRPTPLGEEIDRIRTYLHAAPMDSAMLDSSWHLVVHYVGRENLEAALEIARVEPSLRRPLTEVLEEAAKRHHPSTDSLTIDSYERAMAIADSAMRLSHLERLAKICHDYRLRPCSSFEVPDELAPRWAKYMGMRLTEALDRDRLEAALAIRDTLRRLLSPEDYARRMSDLLERSRAKNRALDSLTTLVLPRLDAVASRMRGPASDTLNARLAFLWIPDLGRADAALARITDETVRDDARSRLARAVAATDARFAYETVRGGAKGISLPGLYVEFRTYGQPARADEVYALMDRGDERMEAKLAWANVLLETGRWREAHDLAFEALEEWDPAAEPRDLSPALFSVFMRLGVFERLVAWARARDTAAARASALASIVGGVVFYRPPREPIS